jgi:anthranilate synthase component 2
MTDDPHVLVVDNYDSFAYNLVQYAGEFAGSVTVRRNDAITLAEIRDLDPDGIIVSPGPGIPQNAGVSMPVFAELSYPTLGVCLGHQALCAVHGAPVDHAPGVVHGKSSEVTHDGEGLYADLPERFEAGRYHSLGVERENLPAILEETAWTDDEPELVMGVRHEDKPHFGVQYHPESILTAKGKDIVERFVREECSTT